jgi:hypothetical protein
MDDPWQDEGFGSGDEDWEDDESGPDPEEGSLGSDELEDADPWEDESDDE